MKKIIALLMLVLILGGFSLVRALDIPLDGATGTSGGNNIGFVDMERIFQLYPQTQYAKEDYDKKLKEKRDKLKAMEAEMDDIKTRISVLESTIEESSLSAPNDPEENSELSDGQANPGETMSPQALTDLKNQLDEKLGDYQEERIRAEQELEAFENQQTQIILGKIYQTLKDLAEEEQVSIVVDKSSILYGTTDIDLTEKLQRRVRGF